MFYMFIFLSNLILTTTLLGYRIGNSKVRIKRLTLDTELLLLMLC